MWFLSKHAGLPLAQTGLLIGDVSHHDVRSVVEIDNSRYRSDDSLSNYKPILLTTVCTLDSQNHRLLGGITVITTMHTTACA